jgi:hypothetical protein
MARARSHDDPSEMLYPRSVFSRITSPRRTKTPLARWIGLSLAIAAAPLAIACSPAANDTGAGGGGGTGGGGATAGSGGSAGGPVVQTCVPFADKDQPAQKLSQTGCMTPTDPKTLAASVIPYEVNSPLWSDGADKTRGMALPAGGKIHVVNCSANAAECPGSRDSADDGKWVLPVGTVMVKSFLFDGKLLETRLLMHFDATTWAGYTYKWDEAQTDAALVGTDRAEVNFKTGQRTVNWHFPSRMDCRTCHVSDTGNPKYAVLGAETSQFNRLVGGSNQIDKLTALGAFEAPVPNPYKAALVIPTTSQLGSPPASATTEQKATSYLHANCSFCHRPSDDIDCFSDPCLDLRFGLPLASRNLCDVTPAKGGFGVTEPKTFAPGHPERSLISIRMKAPPDDGSGRYGRMPYIASYVVDQQAVDLIGSWIMSTTACP